MQLLPLQVRQPSRPLVYGFAHLFGNSIHPHHELQKAFWCHASYLESLDTQKRSILNSHCLGSDSTKVPRAQLMQDYSSILPDAD